MKRILNVIAALIAALIFAACTRTVYVPVQNHVRTVDTVQVARWHRDSVLVRDSVYVERGRDTVKVFKFRMLESLKVRVDTVHDVQIREVVKEVPVGANAGGRPLGMVKEKPDAGGWRNKLAAFLVGILIGILGLAAIDAVRLACSKPPVMPRWMRPITAVLVIVVYAVCFVWIALEELMDLLISKIKQRWK